MRPESTNLFDGSIANFRLYSKALNADQVKELYDYQKDYFLGSKSQVTLYKGHLGVGVTEPSGQLELAGDERLQEYPPRDLGGFETMIEGEGTYKVSSSSDVANPSVGSSDHPAIAFTANDTFFRGVNNAYNTSSVPATYTGTHFTNGVGGDFLQIELPHKINLKSINITSRTNGSVFYDRGPHTGSIFGSNNGGTTWSQVASWTGLNWTLGESKPIQINSNTLYSTYRLVASELQNDIGAGATRFNIDRWRLFGTPGPTTLDKGSLSLGRSLDVPRVSRYDVDTETPRPEKLVVDFDTTVNSSPTDISGEGNHGTFDGASEHYSSADKAFNFDGGASYMFVPQITGATIDNWVHSISVWVFAPSHGETIFQIGHALGGQHENIGLETEATGKLRYYFYSNDVQTPTDSFPLNTWNHVVVTYDGGSVLTSRSVYINGVKQVINLAAGSTLAALDLQVANVGGYIGIQRGGGKPFYGKMSNFKIYNAYLEPSEVKKLYRLGRTGRSMVISDTAVGIGKVPEAQLDVRGRTYSTRMEAQSMLVRSRNNVTWTATSKPWDGGGLTIAREEYPLDTTGAKYWQFDMHSNYNLHISSNGRTTAYILANAGDNALNFTGQHRTFIKNVPFSQVGELEGLIVSSDQNKYIKMSGGIEVGSNAITTNESLPVVSLSNLVTDKKCFGVISASEDPENRTEQYGAFGTNFEKELGDTRVYINSVGEGAIWVSNIGGNLEAGDYITTSNVAGYGQKQDGAGLMNYTVAKITMDCDFEPVTQSVQIIKKDEHGENDLDVHGQIQWEDDPSGATENAYKIRYLDAIGNITDEANHVYKAAFVGCTYHCG
jgi:hypothetical protein